MLCAAPGWAVDIQRQDRALPSDNASLLEGQVRSGRGSDEDAVGVLRAAEKERERQRVCGRASESSKPAVVGTPGAEISALGGASTRRQSPRPSSSTFGKGLSVLHLGTSRSGDLATS